MAEATPIIVGKTSFVPLFPTFFDPLTKEERSELKERIKEAGEFQVAVIVDENNGIIDGINRLQIAAELEWIESELKLDVRCGLTYRQKMEIAYDANAVRRHLTIEKQKEARANRVEQVKQLRAKGKSTRAIAEEVGVSEIQVKADLKGTESAAGGHPCPPAAPPNGEVTGRDGKKYPASVKDAHLEIAAAIKADPSKSNRTIEKETGYSQHTVAKVRKELVAANAVPPLNVTQSPNGVHTKPAEPVDSKGRTLPKPLHEIFESATRFRSLIQRIGAMQTEVEELRKTPAGFRLPVSQIKSDLDNAQSGIKLAMPYVLCPDCGGGKPKGCEYCKERGWLPEGAWNSMTKKRKEICEGTVKV